MFFYYMRQDLIEKGYIPLDKSWMIRMGVLDLVNGYNDSVNYLEQHQEELNEDLKSLYQALLQWDSNSVNVGESGTLYRFLKFASWKFGLDKKFVLQGTLKDREICDNPKIVCWSLERLLTLDNGTSQWASASVLMGNQERIQNPPYKLQVTYDAVEHWKNVRERGEIWMPKFDETILAQASAYLRWLKKRNMDFVPRQAEDYCFARAFGIMSAEEGEARWPSLRGHESNRIAEMEKALQEREVTSRDHRIVQAIAMLRKSKENIANFNCVKKSWPQSWKFLEDSPLL